MDANELDEWRDRFWKYVDKRGQDECWPWLGSKSGTKGYGTMWCNGRSRRATQLSIELATCEPFPAGMMACHHCDNPVCVNPAHLFIGTARDNTRDALAKGRLNITAFRGHHNHRGKTHCKKGHPLSGENLAERKGVRICLTCDRARNLAYWHRTKGTRK